MNMTCLLNAYTHYTIISSDSNVAFLLLLFALKRHSLHKKKKTNNIFRMMHTETILDS